MVFSGGPGKRPRDVQTRLGITGIFSILHRLMKRRSKRPILQNLRLYKHSSVINTVEHPVSEYPKCKELVVAYGGVGGGRV